jgi:uncharacterized membrane protein
VTQRAFVSAISTAIVRQVHAQTVCEDASVAGSRTDAAERRNYYVDRMGSDDVADGEVSAWARCQTGVAAWAVEDGKAWCSRSLGGVCDRVYVGRLQTRKKGQIEEKKS